MQSRTPLRPPTPTVVDADRCRCSTDQTRTVQQTLPPSTFPPPACLRTLWHPPRRWLRALPLLDSGWAYRPPAPPYSSSCLVSTSPLPLTRRQQPVLRI